MLNDSVSFASHGFALFPGVVSREECEAIAGVLSQPTVGSAGSRHLLSYDWCAALALRLQRHESLSTIVPADHMAVQCSYFEKSAERNWLVPVHQDLSIPVAERCDDPGLGGWSQKEGVWFVQPPCELLEQLVAVRLHLDDCMEDDGPLRVVPGSHRQGRIAPEAAVATRSQGEQSCTMAAGGVLVLRPLLLHASSKSTGTSRRRVLHFLFGPPLPSHGLRWLPSGRA